MKLWKSTIVAVLTLLAVNVTLEVSAQSSATSEYSTMELICRKLGRGVTNTAFGVFELPITVMNTNANEGGIAALTYGVFWGIAKFIGREVVGVVEIVTFPMPLPGCSDFNGIGWGYAPIIEPEWVFTPSTDWQHFVYPTAKTLYY